jgi:hypothetical protein
MTNYLSKKTVNKFDNHQKEVTFQTKKLKASLPETIKSWMNRINRADQMQILH